MLQIFFFQASDFLSLVLSAMNSRIFTHFLASFPYSYGKKKKSDKNSARNLYSDEGLIGYQIGDLVAISGQERGVIQYLGSVHFQVNHKFAISTNNDITLSAWNLGWCGVAESSRVAQWHCGQY